MATSSSGGGAPPGGARRGGRSSRRGGLRAALESVLPLDRFGDERTILAGTGQNAVGLLVAILATFGTQILITRVLGATDYGIVTVTTQAALVLGYASRFGMDMAAVRQVAIDVGRDRRGRARPIVNRAVLIAAAVSVTVAAAMFVGAGALGRSFSADPEQGRVAFMFAAVALPFAALVQVYLGATRGLKIMRHTLTVFWVGQPLLWIGFMLLAWLVARSVGATVAAFAGSWIVATAVAAFLWRRETVTFGLERPGRGEAGDLVRYGAPRAPAALFSQLLFWTDLFVLARFEPISPLVTGEDVGIYGAAVRAAQVLLLFMISVNYMFSPFVADLHARGERARLDALYKSLTRWILAATLPVIIVIVVAPAGVLHLFGAEFGAGRVALLVLLVGQAVNVATGSVGFILIMVGRTGWDLVVITASFALDVAVAWILVPRMGMTGAAVAGALTLASANLARLWLVWRFLRIQPFTRAHLLLGFPVVAGTGAALGAHALAGGGAGLPALAATAVAGTLAYVVVLVLVGLPSAERRVARRVLASLIDRR